MKSIVIESIISAVILQQVFVSSYESKNAVTSERASERKNNNFIVILSYSLSWYFMS